MPKLTENAFNEYLEQVKRKIREQLPLTGEKPINYGYQLVVQKGNGKLTLNIYNGKKGLNLVYSGDSNLEQQIRLILEKKAVTAALCEKEHNDHDGLWAGSDESGKGDFFGSLVVAAVVVDNTTAHKLQVAGVKDCKLLSDKKILALENIIKECVVDYSVLELKPKIYNLRYEQVAATGGKLNQLLALGHIAALSQVLSRQTNCKNALIDQFTTSTVILKELHTRFPFCQVRQQPKAESNLAVAAASVLARARFLRTMDELALNAGEDVLPKGGSEVATKAALKIAQVLGKETLRNFVKLHFANYKRI